MALNDTCQIIVTTIITAATIMINPATVNCDKSKMPEITKPSSSIHSDNLLPRCILQLCPL